MAVGGLGLDLQGAGPAMAHMAISRGWIGVSETVSDVTLAVGDWMIGMGA